MQRDKVDVADVTVGTCAQAKIDPPRSPFPWQKRGESAMARTYREVAVVEMLRTVEEAMHRVINRWEDLPPQMKHAVEQFRIQLGAAIDSVEFVRKALDREIHETEHRLD